MGRHSAPDDAQRVAEPAPAVAARPRPGRHERPDEAAEPAPKSTPPAPATPSAPPARPEPEAAETAEQPARTGRGNQPTAADLALLRTRPDVRNRCIAAVVVPFVLYTAVLFLIGAVHVYLIWVWIPLVSAGVLAGSILDAAHKRSAKG